MRKREFRFVLSTCLMQMPGSFDKSSIIWIWLPQTLSNYSMISFNLLPRNQFQRLRNALLQLTHACFRAGWSGATAVDDLAGRNCWITPEAAPLPLEIDERLNATGVVGICRGYCLIGTLDPLLSVDRISSRSICGSNGREVTIDLIYS